MDIKYINDLLDSFYEGTSSFEEEKILLDFFASDVVPNEMRVDRELFLRLHSKGTNVVPPNLEGKLNSLIDRLELEEKTLEEKVVLLNANKPSKSLKWVLSIAASIVILISIGTFSFLADRNNSSNQILADTYSNPEDAYLKAQKALMFVSDKLNQGIEQAERANDIIQ